MVTVPQHPLPSGLITTPPAGPAPVYFEGSVGVPDMPAWVKQIPGGAILQGVVQGRTAHNAYSVLTAQGSITIASALALQPGTQLLFQIGPEVANQRLQLVGGTNPAAAAPAAPPPGPAVPGALPAAVAGATLNALVIRPADPPPAASPATSPTLGTPTPAPAASPGVLPQTAVAAYAPGAASVAATADPASVAMTGLSQPQPGTPPARAAAPPPPVSTPPLSTPPAATPQGTLAPAAPATTAPAAAPAPTPPSSVVQRPGAAPAPSPTPAAPTAPSAGAPPSASPPPALSPSIFALTQPGEQVSVRLVAVTPPPAAPAASATTQAAAQPAAARAPAAAPPTPLGLLREGIASLLAFAGGDPVQPLPGGLPGGTTTAPPAGTPSGALTGTVIGNGVQNRPIVTIGTAVLSLEAAPLPPGTQVQLVPTLGAAPAAGPAAATPAAQAPLQGFPTYPSLPALVAAAQQAGGPTEQAVLAMLPRLGPHLAASLMIFASGAAKGDMRTLIGDSARAVLEKTGRGRAALAGAAQEFEAAGEEARGSGAAEWRGITLPVMTGGATIEPIRLYLHQVSDEEAERNRRNEGGGQRFLLDLDLTRLGSLQVDGLARQNQLDLVIRTPAPLPQALRDGLRSLFLDSAAARGVIGTLAFQVAPKLVPDTGQPVRRPGGLMV